MYRNYFLIGEGSFGYVYRVQPYNKNKSYAIKRIKNTINIDRFSEIRNYEKILCHPNIVKYYLAWEENNDLFLKLECCDLSLADFSWFCHAFPEEFLWAVLYDMCKALKYLHTNHFIHLDVKLANIMTRNGCFKLGDFGIMVDLINVNKHIYLAYI